MVRQARASILVFVSMLLLVACTSAGTSPAATSVTDAPATTGVASPSATGTPAASTTTRPGEPAPSGSPPAASASPASPPPSSPPPSSGGTTLLAYFLLHDPGGGDPRLVPVARSVPSTPAVAAAALALLMAGPTHEERAAGIETVVPDGTRLLSVTIADRMATVDLSGEFASGGGSMSMFGRLAQVVYTVTQFSTVDCVSLELDGTPVTVFSNEGIVLDEPLRRAAYRDEWQPAIFVDRPTWGGTVDNPARIVGEANVFEAVFRVALLDATGTPIATRSVTATCGTGCWGSFDVTVPYDAGAGWGTLRVWNDSARDGQPENIREYRVWLTPPTPYASSPWAAHP